MLDPLTPPDPLEAPTCPACDLKMEQDHTMWICAECGHTEDIWPEPEYDSYND